MHAEVVKSLGASCAHLSLAAADKCDVSKTAGADTYEVPLDHLQAPEEVTPEPELEQAAGAPEHAAHQEHATSTSTHSEPPGAAKQVCLQLQC